MQHFAPSARYPGRKGAFPWLTNTKRKPTGGMWGGKFTMMYIFKKISAEAQHFASPERYLDVRPRERRNGDVG